jgi:dienelactone hydrolase
MINGSKIKKAELNIQEHGFRGTFYDSPQHPEKAIIVFIGSEGSIIPAGFIAERFAALGFSALALYYFGGDNLPPLRAQIPMEFAEKAVAFLKNYDNGRIKKIGTYGDSLGSMPALMAGVLFQDISCVIAVSPTHVVTEGFKTRTEFTGNSFLTYKGKDIPYLPLPAGMNMYQMFRTAYQNTAAENAIPVEQIKGKIIFMASELDEAWPTTDSIKRLEARLIESNFSGQHKAVIFEKASHLVGIVPDLKKHRLVSLLKFFYKQERKNPKECRIARKQSEEEIINWLNEW